MRRWINLFKLPNIFLTLSVVFFIMWLLFRWHYYQTVPTEKIDALFEPITTKYGIEIIYEIGDDFFSPLENPPIPAGPPRHSRVKPIRHRVLMEYPDILRRALGSYPKEVIKNHLSAIYFSGEIDDGDLKYGGTYDPFRRIIYLVDNTTNNEIQALHTFHHEFSSLLLKSHSFWIDPWTDNHPEGFQYLADIHDTWEEMREARREVTDTFCLENGFVTNYGLTNFSNDFSEYSAVIFTYPQKFKEIMSQYPRVRGKFQVWLDFYQKIDPIFTEAYLLGEGENEGAHALNSE